jgi:hypothetical protein
MMVRALALFLQVLVVSGCCFTVWVFDQLGRDRILWLSEPNPYILALERGMSALGVVYGVIVLLQGFDRLLSEIEKGNP